ncbi:phosphate ABC transporter substrate-binding protein [Alcanivorax sp.]|uniref:phosphate ABC transporter substrate-binding protein n=1 Tax=Alcanivorax sp. TaxID=1872427 RepID=UPI0025B8A87E|nr:phosphate ABC transporter substrate-binding protein [Alcanivorax sp.]
MLSRLQCSLGLMVAVFLAGCGESGSAITVSGSSTIAPLMAELAERYETETGIQVDVQSGGSGRAIADVRQGLADLGMVSRALKEDEQDLEGYLIGRDGIAIIVNSANPVRALSDDQIRAIYTGKTQRWESGPGEGRDITVVHKAQGRSTQELFLAYFQLENSQVQPDQVIGENQQGIKAVAGDPFAIGYVSIGTAIYEAENGTPIRLLPLEGAPASLAVLAQGNYPLARELNLVTHGAVSQPVADFLAFVTRTDMADVYHDYYFLPAVE